MIATAHEAEALLERVFDAWNARDVDLMLRDFTDDLVFVEHAGPGGEKYRVRRGARAFGDYLQTYLDVADCASSLNYLAYDGIYIRTVVDFSLVLRAKQLKYVGRFRQVIRLRGDLISHLDEYHDVDASASFWGLADGPD